MWDFNPFKQLEELKKLISEEQAIIVHEAGHAAIAIALSLTPVFVKLGFDGKGLAKVVPEFKGYSTTENVLRIKVLMAGFLAETRYTNQGTDHGALDKRRIREILVEDCITHLEGNIENEVVQFLNANFSIKVLKIAELIAYNYNSGKCETLSAELEHAYRSR